MVGATPLLSGPGRLRSATPDSFTIDARRAGRFVMRLHFSPYWALAAGSGCVRSSPGNYTEVRLRHPGRAVVGMSFSFSRAVTQGPRCT